MADKTYAGVAGFVQFDPNERDVNGKAVRDVVVKAVGSQKLVRITVWPEHEKTEINKGDFLAAEGVFSSNMKDGKEYLNLSASLLVRFPAEPKAEREVVTRSDSGSTSTAKDIEPPF